MKNAVKKYEQQKDFHFETAWFFCENNNHPHNKKIHYVTKIETVIGIIEALNAGEPLNDDDVLLLKHVKILKTKFKSTKAMYHGICYKKFYMYRVSSILGRPRSADMTNVLSFIIDYILKHTDECQFSVQSILRNYDGNKALDIRDIRTHLKNHFGDDIEITQVRGDLTIRFLGRFNFAINDAWYNKKKK